MDKRLFRLLAVLLALALCFSVGCSDDDSLTPEQKEWLLKGNAVDGPIEGAKITITDSRGNEWTASSLTDAAGAYRITLPEDIKGPLRIRLYDGGCDNSTNPCTLFEGEYYALVSQFRGEAASGHPTPLTTLIYFVALARAGGDPLAVTNTDVNAATSIVESLFGLGLEFESIATPPTVQTNQKIDQDILDEMTAHRTAIDFLLYVVENAAAGTDADIDEVLLTFALDIMDGTVDGAADGLDQDLLTALNFDDSYMGMLSEFGQRFVSRLNALDDPAALEAALQAAAAKLANEDADGAIGEGMGAAAVANLGAEADTSGAKARLATSSPVAVQLAVLGTYDPDPNADISEAYAEIVAYDPATQQVYVTNAGEMPDRKDDYVKLDIIDVSDPTAPAYVDSIDVSGMGAGVNSCAVKNGVVAIAIESDPKQNPGVVAFYQTDGTYINHVTVGALPDMVTFTPDGAKVLVANEGEPNGDYTTDPEGSVSIIDISGGAASASVSTAGFAGFNGDKEALIASGVRIFGPNAAVAQDLEPEYIAVNADSTTAYVTLQENNAIAEIDLATATVTGIFPLGYKDHSLEGNGLDASNKDDAINIATWPVLGMYMPDSIAAYNLGGEIFLVTANEGDAREYDAFEEEESIEDLDLDETAFPNASTLQEKENLGKLSVTNTMGDADNDGDYDELYSFGARSFSVWKVGASGLELVFDSGDKMEQVVAAMFPEAFNTTDDEIKFDNRSDNKGPEPEALAIGEIDGRVYAFVGLERMGGIMTFDITIPENPVYCHYINNRNMTWDEDDETTGPALDMAPEGLIFIPASDSPNGKPMLACANEMSGTTTLYSVDSASRKAEFAVFTDPHYYDSSLGTEGAAFEAYLLQDRKLIAESEAIMDSTVRMIRAENPDFVLVCGDLTKDGALASHQEFAEGIAKIEAAGAQVYVVPGNHDVNNPQAYGYEGDNEVAVDNISAEDFATIYADFGYNEAIARDPNSLSYVVQPNDWLRIIGMDSCKYSAEDNAEHAETSGAFSAETLAWIKAQTGEAVDAGFTVIGFQHHNLVEHYTGQSVDAIGADYVIDDYENVAETLADAGMHVVFTGHYHANDITKFATEASFVYDVETGSTVTSPCPWRTVSLDGSEQTMEIATHLIEWIDYDLDGEYFQDYAAEYLEEGLEVVATVLLQSLFGVDAATAQALAPDVAAAYAAHYAGDETPTAEVLAKINAYLADENTATLGQMMGTLWTDLNPSDGAVFIDLVTGESVDLSK